MRARPHVIHARATDCLPTYLTAWWGCGIVCCVIIVKTLVTFLHPRRDFSYRSLVKQDTSRMKRASGYHRGQGLVALASGNILLAGGGGKGGCVPRRHVILVQGK